MRHQQPRHMTLARIVTLTLGLACVSTAWAAEPVKYCRFLTGDRIAYGIVKGDRVLELSGNLFGKWKPTDRAHALADVKLLVPSRPSQVIALAGNYKSHLSDENSIRTTITSVTDVTTDLNTNKTTSETDTKVETRSSKEVPEKFRIPQPFFKSPSCLTAHGGDIVIPKGAETVHFEAELVIVIGKRAKRVPKAKAMEHVFGVTCGNDVSARVWQKNDVQWWRAKGSDTFGPCGPFIVSGLDYDNLLTELRLNGEVKQKENTSHMINDVATTVSFISQHITLNPGDLIYTGTSGKTAAIQPGDVVEVVIENVGVLRNRVVAEKD